MEESSEQSGGGGPFLHACCGGLVWIRGHCINPPTRPISTGGWNGKRALGDMWVYDIQAATWRPVVYASRGLPENRNNHVCVSFGSKLFIHGGHSGSRWLNDVWAFDTGGQTWTQLLPGGATPPPRACHSMNRVGKKIWVFGGFNGERCFNTTDVLDLVDDAPTWQQPVLSGAIPEARNAHTMTHIVGTPRLLLLFGHSGSRHLADVHVLDTEELRWSSLATDGPAPSGLRGHSATLIGASSLGASPTLGVSPIIGSRIIIFGGFDGLGRTSKVSVLRYDGGDVFVWEEGSRQELAAPAGRQRHTASLIDAMNIMVLGGFCGKTWLSDVNILDVGALYESQILAQAKSSLLKNLSIMLNNASMFPGG